MSASSSSSSSSSGAVLLLHNPRVTARLTKVRALFFTLSAADQDRALAFIEGLSRQYTLPEDMRISEYGRLSPDAQVVVDGVIRELLPPPAVHREVPAPSPTALGVHRPSLPQTSGRSVRVLTLALMLLAG
jgi:hypothetical protein